MTRRVLWGLAAVGLLMPIMAQAADTLPPGSVVNDALGANITPDGFTFLSQKATQLVPPVFPIPDTSNSGTCQDFTLANAALAMKVDELTVTPHAGNPGSLQLYMRADMWGGQTDSLPGDPTQYNNTIGRLTFDVCLFDCTNPDYSLLRLMPPAANEDTVVVDTNLFLDLQTDPNTGLPAIHVTTDLDANDITINFGQFDAVGCSAASIISDLINCCLGGLLEGLIEGQIANMVNDQLIPSLEDAFSQAVLDDVLTVQDATVHYQLYPSGLDIRDDGMTIVMASMFEAQPSQTCTEKPNQNGFRFTDGPLPVYTTYAPEIGPYDVGLSASDDVANQALFAMWDAGLLCMDINDLGGEGLNAGFLGLAGLSGALSRMDTPEDAPLSLMIRGQEPPWMRWGGDHHGTLYADRVQIGIMTQVHGRDSRIVALDLSAEAGLDLAVNGDGELEVGLDFSPDALDAVIAYDEVLGQHDAEALTQLLPVLVGSFLPDLAGGIIPPIPINDLGGVGVDRLALVVDGAQGDFFSGYTGLVDTAPGCGSGGGSCGFSGAGCSIGPSTQGHWWSLWLSILLFAVIPVGIVLWRRRVGE